MAIRLAALVVLLAGVVGLQLVRERLVARAPEEAPSLLYVRSPEAARRLALSYSSLIADVYWVRALQHYGRSRLGLAGGQPYDLLFPLLDLTTTLDPLFNIAYRFGAIFLTEPPPGGPGRPDLAISLLEKGLRQQPRRWELAQDIGFVHYRAGEYLEAADWFRRASEIPGSANWLPLLEAVTRTQGGSRATSRQLWQHIIESSGPDEEWMRRQAALRLRQLDALDQIDELNRVIAAYEARHGRRPTSWQALVTAGSLPGIPVDPAGHPYELNPWSGFATPAPDSPINPLPLPETRLP
jgi:tetratricopeptide (TPR) repeat protein